MKKDADTPKKTRKPPPDDIFDQDYAWKTFISKDFFNFLEATQSELHAAVDKTDRKSVV